MVCVSYFFVLQEMEDDLMPSSIKKIVSMNFFKFILVNQIYVFGLFSSVCHITTHHHHPPPM